MRNVRGFTLIELMIVIAIIALLAAIAIPAYQDYVIRAQVSEGLNLASGVKIAVAEFHQSTGRLPSTNASAGVASPVSISGRYVSAVQVGAPQAGVIEVSYGGPKANARLTALAKLDLSPIPSRGSVKWACKSTTIARKYLPTACR